MIRGILTIAAAAVAALAASPAAAATDAQSYAACLFQSRPAQVKQLLEAQSLATANSLRQTLSNNDRCISRVFGGRAVPPEALAPTLDYLRGNLAEQALLADDHAAALQPLPLQQKRYIRPWFATTGRHPAVDEMGACMADTDPAAIMGLIRTAPGSAAESAAIGAMSQSLTKCLSAGTRLDASRTALRAALADALYQRLHSPALSLAQAPERG